MDTNHVDVLLRHNTKRPQRLNRISIGPIKKGAASTKLLPTNELEQQHEKSALLIWKVEANRHLISMPDKEKTMLQQLQEQSEQQQPDPQRQQQMEWPNIIRWPV